MKIAVVGLGIAGLSIALKLADAGHAVDGFEQFDLLHKEGSSHGDTRIFRAAPGEGLLYVALAERSLAGWRAWEERGAVSLLRDTPGLMAGPPASRFLASCLALTPGARLLDAAEVAAQTNGVVRLPPHWRAVRQDRCGVLAADETRAFLISAARAAGAVLHANARIAAPIDSPTLRLNGETRVYDRVIVAAGAWAPALLPETARALTPKRRVVGWLRPRENSAPPPILCVDDEAGLFAMPTPGGLYKIGMHVVGETADPDHVRAPDAEDTRLLAALAAERLPGLEPAPLRVERCLYTLTPDENFLIETAADPRVLLFSCCSGHGFKYAPVFGDLAESWIAGQGDPARAAFGRTARAHAATGLGGEL